MQPMQQFAHCFNFLRHVLRKVVLVSSFRPQMYFLRSRCASRNRFMTAVVSFSYWWHKWWFKDFSIIRHFVDNCLLLRDNLNKISISLLGRKQIVSKFSKRQVRSFKWTIMSDYQMNDVFFSSYPKLSAREIVFILKRSKIAPLCISMETVEVAFFFNKRTRNTSNPRSWKCLNVHRRLDRVKCKVIWSISHDLFINLVIKL
jgi:hypothetical protein